MMDEVIQETRAVNAAAADDLTGFWTGNDGALFFVKQDVITLWWVGLDDTPGFHGPGLNVTHVFRGEPPSTHPFSSEQTLAGEPGGVTTVLGITGSWADVPRGTRMLSGRLTVRHHPSIDGSAEQLVVIAQSGGFTTNVLTRTAPPDEEQAGIQTVLNDVQKNVDGETLGQNLTAYKDHVVLFGNIMGDESGATLAVHWRINDDRTYRAFICPGQDGDHDGDANTNIAVDRTRLDLGGDFDQPNFWTQGWEPDVDPQDIRDKLDENNNLHLEMIMFGRRAPCSAPQRFDDPPLLPGWQEIDGNSVLINGRPLNGLSVNPAIGGKDVPTRVDALNNVTIRLGTPVRVTGPLVLDVGHATGDDIQEIHPVYTIDVLDRTTQDDLSGVWADNLGNTYYVRHLADTVWWFGKGPVRDRTFGQVFQGTLTGGRIEGVWEDVSFGSGHGSGLLRLTVDPDKLHLVPDPQGAFSNRRWLKLYHVQPPLGTPVPLLVVDTSVSFGRVTVGAEVQRNVHMQNAGLTEAVVSVSSPPDGSPFQWAALTATVAPGDSLDLTVRFDPPDTRDFNVHNYDGTLTVQSNDAKGPHVVTLGGEGKKLKNGNL